MPLDNQQTSRVTSKGQVLLHKSVRDALGITSGTEVRVGSNGQGQAIVEPVTAWPSDPEERGRRINAALEKWSGVFHDGRSTDEKMRELRGDPEL